MTLELCITFILIITILLLSPGPSVLLSINNGINYGKKLAVFGVLGNVVAFQLLLVTSATGLGKIILSVNELVIVVHTIGAIYLCYVGWKTYHSPLTILNNNTAPDNAVKTPAELFKQAFIVTALNPKALLFITAFLPQFINNQIDLLPQVALLSGISAIIHFSIYFTYASLASRSRRFIKTKTPLKVLNKTSGVVFILFALSMVMSVFST